MRESEHITKICCVGSLSRVLRFLPVKHFAAVDPCFSQYHFHSLFDMRTKGTDVKVYTVGPDYGHAEARKSPVVDGRVNRDSVGLEVRYPVILTPLEKEIAFKVVTTFKQTVCGFDIMRAKGKS